MRIFILRNLGVLPCLALISTLLLGGCSRSRNVTIQDDSLEVNQFLLTDSVLPALDSLPKGVTLKSASNIYFSVDGWQGADYCSGNAEQIGSSVLLNSGEMKMSAAWYGFRLDYNSQVVPYLAPYYAVINTEEGGDYWIVLADYASGLWVVDSMQTSGAPVGVNITLDANAANSSGYCWLAIITFGGSQVQVNSIMLSYPDSPSPGNPVQYHQWVEMQDGISLATDIYLPYAEDGPLPDPPYPVIMQRTCYSRSSSSAAKQYSDQNIVFVEQSVRGRPSTNPGWPNSQGEPTLFRDTAGPNNYDASDMIAWLESRTWYNGTLALFGGSGPGLIGYQVAASQGEHVSAYDFKVASADMGEYGCKRNGCLRESVVIAWLGSSGYPIELQEEARQGYNTPGYWEGIGFANAGSSVGSQGFLETGWFDLDIESSIQTWHAFITEGIGPARGNQWIIIGPWTHGGLRGNWAGGMSFPNTGDIHDPSALPPEWNGIPFNLYKLGRNDTYAPPLHRMIAYFVGDEGSTEEPHNAWYEFDSWPPPSYPVTYYMASTNLLVLSVPPVGSCQWNSDPKNPIETHGGANLFGMAGPYNQQGVGDDQEVLRFASTYLSSDLPIAGPAVATIYVSTASVDTDIMAKLVDIYPNGKAMLVADSAVRLSWYLEQKGLGPVAPGQTYEVELEVGERAWVFAPGHRVGLWIQSTNYPRFAVNPGNGDDYLNETGTNGVTQQNTLYFGVGSESMLVLPMYDPR